MKKRILSLLISTIVVISFAGCGQAGEKSSTDSTVSSSGSEEVTAQEPVTDSNGTLTAVVTAGGYEIPLTELAHQTENDVDSKVFYTFKSAANCI